MPPFNWSERGARPDPLPNEEKTRLNTQGEVQIGPKAGRASKRLEIPPAPHEKTPGGHICTLQKNQRQAKPPIKQTENPDGKSLLEVIS